MAHAGGYVLGARGWLLQSKATANSQIAFAAFVAENPSQTLNQLR